MKNVEGHSQREIRRRTGVHRDSARLLDSDQLIARHRRAFAGGLTFTDPAHQALLDGLRGERRRGPSVEVETRPLARYDALIPA